MFDSLGLAFGELTRIAVIGLGFVAMWSLWVARRDRKNRWTAKMKDIWLCHILFVAAAVESNIEHLHRNHFPTAATFLLGAIMLLTIKGTFNGETYTKDECQHCAHCLDEKD